MVENKLTNNKDEFNALLNDTKNKNNLIISELKDKIENNICEINRIKTDLQDKEQELRLKSEKEICQTNYISKIKDENNQKITEYENKIKKELILKQENDLNELQNNFDSKLKTMNDS